MEQLNCPDCKSEDWIVVNGQRLNHQTQGPIILEKRECVDCNTRFDVGIDDAEAEFYYRG